MIKRYYLADGLEKTGPFSLQELREREITVYTLVWVDGINEWTPAGKVEELKELFDPSAAPSAIMQRGNAFPVQKEFPRGNVSYDRSVYIATAVAIAVVIFAFAYFAFTSQNASNANDLLQTDTAQIDEDKKRLQELEEKEKLREAENELLAKQNREYRNNWNKYIGYTTNEYRVKTFGGISNLQVTVTNQTNKIIDEVVVTIEYFKANGDLYTTKNVAVPNIQPSSSGTVKVENTTRGNKIETRITKITSRSLNFCYNSRLGGNSGEDPWYCR